MCFISGVGEIGRAGCESSSTRTSPLSSFAPVFFFSSEDNSLFPIGVFFSTNIFFSTASIFFSEEIGDVSIGFLMGVVETPSFFFHGNSSNVGIFSYITLRDTQGGTYASREPGFVFSSVLAWGRVAVIAWGKEREVEGGEDGLETTARGEGRSTRAVVGFFDTGEADDFMGDAIG